MSLPAPLFLAARYLKPKCTFLAVITLIFVLGVTLGITILILIMSVMTGFERELQRKVMGFDAHLLLTNNGLIEGWRGLGEKAAKAPRLVAVAPFVQGPVIVEYNHQRLAPKIRRIDPARNQGTLPCDAHRCRRHPALHGLRLPPLPKDSVASRQDPTRPP